PARIDPAKLLADAKSVLGAALADPSPRIRIAAAVALSRTGDERAVAVLATALAADASEIRRIEVAYALGRAGDARGSDYLAGEPRPPRRAARLEAARPLALLGDARGRARLREACDATQLRLGAAEALATLGDPQGVAILHEALASRSSETRLRAAVALGR